jgi:hypothetical protein
MKIRIHHFFDIIRDFGSGKEIVQHPFQHSYHKIASQIFNDSNLKLEIVIESDDVCHGCVHLIDKKCDDVINHRKDFTKKEDFNNHLDKRISEVCGICPSVFYTPKELCSFGKKYIKNIFYIYEGNDILHTEIRKRDVQQGLRLYDRQHGFNSQV